MMMTFHDEREPAFAGKKEEGMFRFQRAPAASPSATQQAFTYQASQFGYVMYLR